jgi:pilus assembly protein Flp/PilA
MLTHFRRYAPQHGQGLVEYALIIALVAIVVIAILVIMGPQIGDIFSNITNGL